MSGAPTSNEAFNKSAQEVKNLTGTPSNEEMLELYALFKQSTVGDCNTECPGMMDFAGKYKWQEWNKHKGTPVETAQTKYIEKVESLKAKYN
ncbi:hypothetical protein DSO57_1004274 [Entomophthora muscae]|uniref:Uncharacterized protein n=3 Tax=Entomophthora muscae TaxID=34485 RepID=A0ACC2RZB4_9FUNG|nr:hypothetical protein DSO57_1015532 [Entomophthora muscae]KAJ9055414.1 hypothetical protein DSO57_1004274 [Entomophthora muscae]KAJ9055415.1 hypothetical protein DSO57_1004274 [Entomophthora muscae]